MSGATGSGLSLAIADSRIPYLEKGVGSGGLYRRRDTKDLDMAAGSRGNTLHL